MVIPISYKNPINSYLLFPRLEQRKTKEGFQGGSDTSAERQTGDSHWKVCNQRVLARKEGLYKVQRRDGGRWALRDYW